MVGRQSGVPGLRAVCQVLASFLGKLNITVKSGGILGNARRHHYLP